MRHNLDYISSGKPLFLPSSCIFSSMSILSTTLKAKVKYTLGDVFNGRHCVGECLKTHGSDPLLKSCLCHLLAVCPSVSYLTHLHLSSSSSIT